MTQGKSEMFDRVMAALDKECTVDAVHPNHYKLPGGMQVIDVEVAMFGKEWVQHHCVCTAVEYLLRHLQKNGSEDVKKAKWWIDKWCELDKSMQKPLQKPLTHKEAEELLNSGVRVWNEARGHYEEPKGVNSGHLETEGYGTCWRCWAYKPTDEEMEAAAWEN